MRRCDDASPKNLLPFVTASLVVNLLFSITAGQIVDRDFVGDQVISDVYYSLLFAKAGLMTQLKIWAKINRYCV